MEGGREEQRNAIRKQKFRTGCSCTRMNGTSLLSFSTYPLIPRYGERRGIDPPTISNVFQVRRELTYLFSYVQLLFCPSFPLFLQKHLSEFSLQLSFLLLSVCYSKCTTYMCTVTLLWCGWERKISGVLRGDKKKLLGSPALTRGEDTFRALLLSL